MKKYYLSHIDFSELVNVTADPEQLDRARERMQELGMLTEKGNPSVSSLTVTATAGSKAFFIKLHKRLRRRGGAEPFKATLQKLYDRKDYYGCFLYIAFLYGFLEWQVPERVMLLPAVPEALKCYCGALLSAFDSFLSSGAEAGAEEPAEDESTADAEA